MQFMNIFLNESSVVWEVSFFSLVHLQVSVSSY